MLDVEGRVSIAVCSLAVLVMLSQCCEITAAGPGCQSKPALRGEERLNRVHVKAYCNMVANPATIIIFTLATACVCVCKQELCALNLLQYLGQGDV